MLEYVKLLPISLMNVSGSAFYSGRNAFIGQKNLYILGLNPGGSPIEQKEETLSWHTSKVLKNSNPNWSEYKDESWNGHYPGTYGLQPRVLHMLSVLGLSPYDVPASNICFVRSNREETISQELNSYAEMCWPFHQKVIQNLRIKVILCFGKRAGDFVRYKLKANRVIDEFVEVNARKWRSQAFKSTDNLIVITATHPSIADWTRPETDPSGLVKKFVES
jgi:uracil-DNA glycosylase family 4